ncbi:MAG: di-trans,poly-cis-decaprenylcistransferase [Methanotrichaceae archaeon]|nr:di-trans,poly-cis-decaprenylcistransferase [Methanotrichaceae archaeon]
MSFILRNPAYTFYERLLKSRILAGVPVEHVAIIQDGNRRFARQKGLSKFLGHSLGADTSERVMDWCLDVGVRHLTLYAFSTENFSRNETEKRYLFDLIKNKFIELKRSKKIHHNQIRVRAIGRVEMLPQDLQEEICRTQEATRKYDNMYLNVALAYGGQRELIDAARYLARQVSAGKIKAADVDENLIAQHLYPQDGIPVPKVDLIIRTGGDCRTSNFLPWQANGNECAAYFCAPYWPEFRKIDFLRAIRTAQTRSSGQ